MIRIRTLLLGWPLAAACHDGTAVVADETHGSTSSTGTEPPPPTTSTTESGPVDSSSDDSSAGSTSSYESSSSSDSSSEGPIDTPPAVVDDLYRTPMDVALVVAPEDGVLANDVDPETITLGLVEVDAESEIGGTVIVDDYGGFTYTPPPGAWGHDSFGYTAIDSGGNVAAATVTINLLPVAVPLADVASGIGGYAIEGSEGFSAPRIAVAGDVDGDGIDDVVLGSQYSAQDGARVVFGKPDHAGVSLAAVDDGLGGFRIVGPMDYAGYAGRSVAGAGDVNGDGLDDVLVAQSNGGPVYELDSAMPFIVYVVFGKADGTEVQLADIEDGIGGFAMIGTGRLNGVENEVAVAGARDVDADGLADILIGVGRVPGTEQRRYWVVFGKADTAVVDLDALGDAGFVLEGAPGTDSNYCPYCVAGLGDVDGDGFDDVVVGNDGALDYRGRAYVVHGKADSAPVDLAEVEAGVGGFAIVGESFQDFIGRVVSRAGDVDGDGLEDVLIGADGHGGDDDPGRGYVVFGKADNDPVDLADVTAGSGGFAILAHQEGARLGFSAAGGGDIDGDGLSDVVLGSLGRLFVVYGKADTVPVDLAATPNGSAGFFLDPEVGGDYLGWSVAIEGDVDDDGRSDVLGSSANVYEDLTRTYVVAGVSTAPKP